MTGRLKSRGWVKMYRDEWNELIESVVKQHFNAYDRGGKGIILHGIIPQEMAETDLYILANHTDGKIMFNHTSVAVHRGEMVTSEKKLALRWRWSRKKVDNFLEELQKAGIISLNKNNKRTIIKLLLYDDYYGSTENDKALNTPDSAEERTAKRPQKSRKRIEEELQTRTNKNKKNFEKSINYYDYDESDPIVKRYKELWMKRHPETSEDDFVDEMVNILAESGGNQEEMQDILKRRLKRAATS